MSARTARLVITALAAALIAASIGWWATARSAAAQPADHTIYCSWHGGLPVGFVAGPGLGSGCPPGFRRVSGAR